MSDKLITEMNAEEFDQIIETFIERETESMGEIDAPLFYDALEEIFSTVETQTLQDTHIDDGFTEDVNPRTDESLTVVSAGEKTVVALDAHVVGAELQLNLDADNSSAQVPRYVDVQKNEIVINNMRFVINLVPQPSVG